MKCDTCGLELNEALVAKVKSYDVPFRCQTCGMLTFPYRAINGLVMVWPKPIPETQGSIYIPERIRAVFKTTIGIVMSTGKGCVEKSTKKFVKSTVVPGDILSYDKNVPWQVEVPDSTGKTHTVDMMNILDVLATVKE